MSLALSTLIYEWRRYFAAIIALAVAGLLVLALTGMFLGAGKAFTATIDKSPAEIMVLPADADSLFGSNTGLPRRMIPEIYQHPDVADVMPLDGSWAYWQNFPKDGQPAKGNGVRVVVVDPTPGALTVPTDFTQSDLEILQEPYAIIMDKSSEGKLGAKLGDKAKMNGSTINVRGETTHYPSMFNDMVFTSRQTAKLLYVIDEGPRVGSLLVKVKDPKSAKRVVSELNSMGKGQYKAWTREQLSATSEMSILKEGPIMVILIFMVVVGFFIGIVITWQTLQAAILANIKEFAGLRALGVSMGSLRLIIIELSFWVGVFGLFITAGLVGLIVAAATAFSIPMDFPLYVDIPVAIVLLLIAVLSGVFSLGVLKKSQPADLLR
ncbi:MAG: ABC transporter permease [Asticcacaulis sp.]